jgi:hypothetical protein
MGHEVHIASTETHLSKYLKQFILTAVMHKDSNKFTSSIIPDVIWNFCQPDGCKILSGHNFILPFF